MPKTKEEIRATTSRIPKPANYKYGEKLPEWDSAIRYGTSDLFLFDPVDDRIIVRLIEESEDGVVLTDHKPLIGGKCRKAIVLKCGPGKWMLGGKKPWRRRMGVEPGQIVYIGNWVDLEGNGLALCQEGDVRVYVRTDCGNS